MKKNNSTPAADNSVKKGYNEKNPGQPEGAFPPATHKQPPEKKELKSNAAAKKAKEDEA